MEAKEAMQKRLFYERFEDFVAAKQRPRESREQKYGRENITGVGLGLKNFPERLGMREIDFGRGRGEPGLNHSPSSSAQEFWLNALTRYRLRLSDQFSDNAFMRPCVRVLVDRKVPENLVEPDLIVSKVIRELGFDFPTDVVEVGDIVATMNTGVYRPVTCGVSGGPSVGEGGGTLGCIVGKKDSQDKFMLTCNHVVANLNRGMRDRDPILQPCMEDGGTMKNRIGVLADYAPLDFSGKPNYVDAALVRLDSGIRADPSMEGAHFTPKDHTAPWEGQPVKKVGRSTGTTSATVNGTGLSLQGELMVEYGRLRARFDDVFSVGHSYGSNSYPVPFGVKGDSGSLIVEQATGRAVGLLISRSKPYLDAYGCTFSHVKHELGVEL